MKTEVSPIKNLITSRQFWSVIITLLVMLVAVFVPGFELDLEQVVSLVIIIGPYILGVTVDPGTGWKGLLASRKFWAALIGLVVVFLDAFHLVFPKELPPEMLISFCTLLGAYISGVALERYVAPPGAAG